MTPAVLLLALAVAAPGVKDPPKKDPPALVGEWVAEGTVAGGTPKRLPAGAAWVFTADGRAELRLGRAADRGTYTADPARDPAEVDLDLGPGSRLRGIYKVDGDTLTLCLAPAGADRPTTFDSPDKSDRTLFTLKRAKKKE